MAESLHHDCGIAAERISIIPNGVELPAASSPVMLVSDTPANVSVVRHQENGWVVPVNDSQALAAAMLELLADEPLSLKLGRAARQTIEEGYTVQQVAGQLVALYKRLIAENRNQAWPLAMSAHCSLCDGFRGNASRSAKGHVRRVHLTIYCGSLVRRGSRPDFA